MNDSVKSELDSIADSFEMDYEEVEEVYETKLEDVKSRSLVELPEEKLQKNTLRVVRSTITADQRTDYGETMDIPVLAIGFNRVFEDWGDDNETVLVAHGVIKPSEDDPLGIGTFFLSDADGLDPYRLREKFTARTTLRAKVSVSENDLDHTYQCRSIEDGYVKEVTDPDDLGGIPVDVEDQLKLLHNVVEEATIEDITEHLSITDSRENSDGSVSRFPTQFGADMRRINGDVVDVYIPDDRSNSAIYTIRDATVFDEADFQEYPELEREDGDRTPGLTVWVDQAIAEFGEGSQVEFYGPIQEDDDTGQITMNAIGAVVFYPEPIGDEDVSSGADEESL